MTGSCSLVETGPFRIIVDCGMFQGDAGVESKNFNPLPFDAKSITHVVVTHAHLDHVGRLPVLVKNGYAGQFFATRPTVELAKLVMDDAFGIMEYDNKKFGRPLLHGPEDIAGVMERSKGVEYDEPIVLKSGGGEETVRATWHDAGHIFGSAFIVLEAEGKRVVFSGDVGNVEVPILRDTAALPKNVDLLVSESTYGDRLHETKLTRQQIVENMIADGTKRGGVVMIPSFSLERTQELIYELNDLIDRQHRLPPMPIFLDSPLAIDALKVYRKYPEYYDEEAEKYLQSGDDVFDFKGLTTTYTRTESMKINHIPGPKIIIAGAGMMNGGRILHHARRYLSDEKSTLLLIGYQSPGTLGHQIYSGKSPVRVLGDEVPVKCQVKMVGALSAHGDQKKLLQWIGAAQPKKVFLNHGDPWCKEALAKKLGEVGIAAEPASSELKVEI